MSSRKIICNLVQGQLYDHKLGHDVFDRITPRVPKIICSLVNLAKGDDTCNQRWKVEIWLIVCLSHLIWFIEVMVEVEIKITNKWAKVFNMCNFRLYTCGVHIQIGLYSMIDCDLFEIAWIILIRWDYNLQQFFYLCSYNYHGHMSLWELRDQWCITTNGSCQGATNKKMDDECERRHSQKQTAFWLKPNPR